MVPPARQVLGRDDDVKMLVKYAEDGMKSQTTLRPPLLITTPPGMGCVSPSTT